MRFLRLCEVDLTPPVRVFRYSLARAAVLVIGLICIGVALVLVDWEGRRRSSFYIAYYVSAVLLLGVLFMRKFVLARLRPSNWLARMTSDRL